MESVANVAKRIIDLETQAGELTRSKRQLEKSIGIRELSTIYGTCIRSQFDTFPSVDDPLIEFNMGDMNYQIVFGFLADRLPNEYLLVDHLSKFLDIGLMDSLIQDIDLLETNLMNNALETYSQLSNARKNAHSELRKLIASKKKKYTYCFPGKEYKKYIMGFVVLTKHIKNAETTKL